MKQTMFFLWAILIALFAGCNEDNYSIEPEPEPIPTSISIALTDGKFSMYNDTAFVAEKDKITFRVTVKDKNSNVMSTSGATIKSTCGTVSNFEIQVDSLTTGWTKSGQVYAEIKSNGMILTSNIIEVTVVYRFFYDQFKVTRTSGYQSFIKTSQIGRFIIWGSSPSYIGNLIDNKFYVSVKKLGVLFYYEGTIINRNQAQGTYNLGGTGGTFIATRQ